MITLPFMIFMYFTEMVIVYSYAKSIYEKRSKFSLLIPIILYGILMIIYRYFVNIEIINIILTLICNILCIYASFKSALKSAFFHGVMLGIIQFVSEVCSIYIISNLTSSANNSYMDNPMIYMTEVILCRIIYFVISRLLMRLSIREKSNVNWGRWCLLSILPLSSLFIIVVIRILTNGLVFSSKESLLCIIALMLLLVSNIIVYVIYEQLEKNTQKVIELEMINQKNNIDLQYLNLLEKKNEQMYIMAHDYKNHILTIESMSESPEIKTYITDMLGEISQFHKTGKTKNKLLDVIISKYLDICKDKNITFEIDTISENLIGINNNLDISSLFNNLLDNAVEAAEKSERRYIELHISNSINSYHKITVTNSCDIEPTNKEGNFISIKKNKKTHGFGTKSIKKTIDKYHGEMQWEYNKSNREFKIVILIPIEQ